MAGGRVLAGLSFLASKGEEGVARRLVACLVPRAVSPPFLWLGLVFGGDTSGYGSGLLGRLR